LLPSEIEEYGTRQELRAETLAFINKYVDLPDGMDVVCAVFVELSWLYDAFETTPYLCFRHPRPAMGKTRALKTIGALMRRPICISGDSTSASYRRIISNLGGSLLVDEADFCQSMHSDLIKMLKSGFQQTGHSLINVQTKDGDWVPTPFYTYGPKVIAHHFVFGDSALQSRFIDCFMKRRTRDIPTTIDALQFDREALSLRNKYLAIRRDYLPTLAPRLDAQSKLLNDRTNQIGLPLLTLALDPTESRVLVETLRSIQDRRNDALQTSEEGMIVAVALEVAKDAQRIHLAMVAHRLVAHGITPRQVGKVLGELGLKIKHGRDGNYAVVNADAKESMAGFLNQ